MVYYLNKTRPAFTMLELVFVVVILGIVASIGAEVIARTYEGYINQRAVYKASIKTELVATQIANRLAYAIPGSITRNNLAANQLLDISTPEGNDPLPVLQWIGYDRDGFSSRAVGNAIPGWSGFIDLGNTNQVGNTIVLATPGSVPALSNVIIGNLGGVGLVNRAAVYFPKSVIHDGAANYNAISTNMIYGVTGFAPNQLTVTRPVAPIAPQPLIQEQYKLAWTAYAIVPVQRLDNANFDLTLRYDYRPWMGETFVANGNASILLRNVSVFRFTGSINSIRFKLCVQEQTGGTNAVPTFTSICKEKVVIK